VRVLQLMSCRGWSSDAYWAARITAELERAGHSVTLVCRRGTEERVIALARAAGYGVAVVREPSPGTFSREDEDRLLDLCASGNADPSVWSGYGSAFFMGGLAVLLSSTRGFEREKYLRLAEALHVGVTTPEVFGLWLARTPVQASRFLPMLRMRRQAA